MRIVESELDLKQAILSVNVLLIIFYAVFLTGFKKYKDPTTPDKERDIWLVIGYFLGIIMLTTSAISIGIPSNIKKMRITGMLLYLIVFICGALMFSAFYKYNNYIVNERDERKKVTETNKVEEMVKYAFPVSMAILVLLTIVVIPLKITII